MSETIVEEIDDKRWETVVEKSGKPVAVMFYSPLCPHCALMMPHFEKYAEDLKEKVLFAKIDIERNPTTTVRYGVMGTPTFKFFCSGKPVQEIVGAVYPHILKRTAEETLTHGKECASKSTPIDYNIGYA